MEKMKIIWNYDGGGIDVGYINVSPKSIRGKHDIILIIPGGVSNPISPMYDSRAMRHMSVYKKHALV